MNNQSHLNNEFIERYAKKAGHGNAEFIEGIKHGIVLAFGEVGDALLNNVISPSYSDKQEVCVEVGKALVEIADEDEKGINPAMHVVK